MPVFQIDQFGPPYGDEGPSVLKLSTSELRESAYEILIAAYRSSGTRPLTYIPQSERTAAADRGQGHGNNNSTLAHSPSLQRSLTSTAASKVKKALGMKSGSSKRTAAGQARTKKTATVGELVRVQMRVSEQADSRIRRAMLRVAAGQLGRRIESMVLPLELLQQFKSSDFPNQQDYEVWQKRILKLLEAGLLLYPRVPLDKSDTAARRLQQVIRGALDKPLEAGRNTESMQVLRNVVMSLACRSLDGSAAETCHWADGFPLNLRLYQTLLEMCFDVNDESVVIDEVDEVIELIKKTWTILGVNQTLHNICFLWVLFHRYVSTGQIEDDLLFASNSLMMEVEKDAKATKDPQYSKIASSTLNSILDWAEKRLLFYHDSFNSDNTESMDCVASLAVVAAKLLVEDISNEYHRRKEVDVACERTGTYIRSSINAAFGQASFHCRIKNIIASSKQPSRHLQGPLPQLAMFAQEISQLAFSEKAIFSPIFKRWHPHAAGVAVATLHLSYGKELKRFISTVSELTPDAIQVLTAADRLEKDLVQIAVEDAVDSEDGGKSIIQQMPPYEAEAAMANLVKSWIKTRVDRLKEWVDRNLQQEVWNPRANKERFAPSAVEVLRTVDETLEAFFLLPIPMHSVLLPELVAGLDRCLQNYILKAKSGCSSRNAYIPTLPAMTRCAIGSKFHVFKKEKSQMNQRRKSQIGTINGDDLYGIPQLCVRLNTCHHIRTQLEVLEKRTAVQLRNCIPNNGDEDTNGVAKKFEVSATACVEGVQQLCEAMAYKVVFQDLRPFMWDGLYVGEVSSSRIDTFLEELEQYLEIISSMVHDRVRTRAITVVMRACLDGFLLVLLAGGSSRSFTLHDYVVIEEDFKFLRDLFWSNGDGLPVELIDKYAVTLKSILPLYRMDSEVLIERLRSVATDSYGSAGKSRLPLPPTTGNWSPSDPNTLLRVLCYRNDETATKFLKKTYNLPKKH
ncbi:Protein unc-13 homolog [Linum perenne]